MRLSANTPAPKFTGTLFSGEELSLSDLAGEPLWLAFFRYAACPLCNLRVHHIIQRWDQYVAAGLKLVTVFQSPAENVRKYVGQQEPPFPIVCDPDETLYGLYGLESSLAGYLSPANVPLLAKASRMGYLRTGGMDGTKTRIPADFLIDREGTVQTAYYGRKISDHIPFEDVDRFIETIQPSDP